MLDLIAFNQINLYLRLFRSFKEQERVVNNNFSISKIKPEFRILPRSIEQTRYSCIFVPDTELKDDQYFHGEVEVLVEESSSNARKESISVVSQQIMPSDGYFHATDQLISL